MATRRRPARGVVGRERDVERLAQQRERPEACPSRGRRAVRTVPDDDVVVGGERPELVLADVHVDEHELDARVFPHPAEEAGEQELGGRREDREVDLADGAVQVLAPGGVHRGDGGGRPGGEPREHPAVLGEADAAAPTFDERDPGLPLEGAELLRHRTRGAVGGLGDGGDAAAVGEFAEDREELHVEVDHAGTLHRRCRIIRWCYSVVLARLEACSLVTVSSPSSWPWPGG